MNAHVQRWAWEILCDRGNSGCSHSCCVSDLQLSQLRLFLLHTITNPVKNWTLHSSYITHISLLNFRSYLLSARHFFQFSICVSICVDPRRSHYCWIPSLPSLNSACERLLWQQAKKDRCSSASCCIIYVRTSMLLCLFRPTILSSMGHVLHFINKVNDIHKAPSLIWW